MTPRQTIELRMSEQRQKINDLLGKDERTDEQRTELETLTGKMQTDEVELRAAIAAEPDPNEKILKAGDGEGVELRALVSKASISNYINASAKDKAVEGAERELNQHYKLDNGYVPMEIVVPRTELRTKAANEDSNVTPQAWVDRLFFDTQAAYLGIAFQSVPAGTVSVLLTKTGPTPAQRGREQAQAAGAWTVGVTELNPTRMTNHIQYAREDMLRLPGLEAALGRDLQTAITERVDHTIFLGDAGANEDTADIAAITATTGITAQTLTQANKVKATETLAEFIALVDGKHAGSTADIRAVAAVGWNTLMRATMAKDTVSLDTLAAFLNANGVTWQTRGGLGTTTGAGDLFAMIALQRGLQGAVHAVMWDAAELIRDPYTGASKGQISVTLSTYWNYMVTRATNFATLSAA